MISSVLGRVAGRKISTYLEKRGLTDIALAIMLTPMFILNIILFAYSAYHYFKLDDDRALTLLGLSTFVLISLIYPLIMLYKKLYKISKRKKFTDFKEIVDDKFIKYCLNNGLVKTDLEFEVFKSFWHQSIDKNLRSETVMNNAYDYFNILSALPPEMSRTLRLDIEADVCEENHSYTHLLTQLEKISFGDVEITKKSEDWQSYPGKVRVTFRFPNQTVSSHLVYADIYKDYYDIKNFLYHFNNSVKSDYYRKAIQYYLTETNGTLVYISALSEEQFKKLKGIVDL